MIRTGRVRVARLRSFRGGCTYSNGAGGRARIYHIAFWIAYRFIARVRRELYPEATRSKQSPLPVLMMNLRTMKMTIEGYQNPEAAHSNLVARSKQSEKPAPVQSFE